MGDWSTNSRLTIPQSITLTITPRGRGSLCGAMTNMLACDFVLSEFELQSRNYVWTNNLEKGMKSLIRLAMGLIFYCYSTKMALILNNAQNMNTISTYLSDPKRFFTFHSKGGPGSRGNEGVLNNSLLGIELLTCLRINEWIKGYIDTDCACF